MSESHDARCVAVECVCVVESVEIESFVCLWLSCKCISKSNTMLLVVVVVVQMWSCCNSYNKNSTYCRDTAYCDSCDRSGGHSNGYYSCQRSTRN